MRRQSLIRTIVLALVVMVTVSIGAGVYYIITVQQSVRPTADQRVVLDALPAGATYLAGDAWQREYRGVYGDPAGLTLVYSRVETDQSLLFEVSATDEPYLARLRFWRENRKGALEDDKPGRVQEITAENLRADNAMVLCASVQDSRTGDYERCGQWIYWARYGQYLLYVSANQEAMNKQDFLQLVTTTDENMDQALR